MVQAVLGNVKSEPVRLLLRAKEAAAALGMSERWLWSLTKEGRIKSIRLNRSVRYYVDDLREFIAAQAESVT